MQSGNKTECALLGFIVHLGKDYRKVGIHKTTVLYKLVTRRNVPCWVEFDVHPGKDYIKVGIHKTSLLVSEKHSWAQRKLSPLSPLNILLTINGPLLS